jgi:hypothetical protein
MSLAIHIRIAARTPPPTLLFLSSLVKEHSPHRDEEEPQTARPSLGIVRSLKRAGQNHLSGPPSMNTI